IFAVASLTDWLDGYLARRTKQITGLGQWMDPLADKLLVTAAFVSLVYLGLAPAWMVVVILGREFFVTVLRSIAHARGHALPASPLGKVKMVAPVAAIVSAVGYARKVNVLMAPPPEAVPVTPITVDPTSRETSQPPRRASA